MEVFKKYLFRSLLTRIDRLERVGLFLAAEYRLPTPARRASGVRISHPKIGKLACQAQGVGIFAKSEYPYFERHPKRCPLFKMERALAHENKARLCPVKRHPWCLYCSSSENKSSILTFKIFAITKISLSVALRTCPSSFE